MIHCFFFFSSRRRHTRCTLVTGVQTCALPICKGSPTKEYTFGVAISSDSLGKALASEAPQPPFDEANIASPDLVFLTLPENPNGQFPLDFPLQCIVHGCPGSGKRSEEHTSELQSLMRISYAVVCWHHTPP